MWEVGGMVDIRHLEGSVPRGQCCFSTRDVDIHPACPYSPELMTSTGHHFFSRALTAAGFALLMVSCAGTKTPQGNGGAITKVKYYFLDDIRHKPVQVVTDPSIPFERQHYLYGAVGQKELSERYGNYYTVFWKADDRSQPVKVRLEYRQKLTGLTIKTTEQEVTDIRKNNITQFAVIGEAYEKGGPVSCWRASLVRGKETLADSKSYLWEK